MSKVQTGESQEVLHCTICILHSTGKRPQLNTRMRGTEVPTAHSSKFLHQYSQLIGADTGTLRSMSGCDRRSRHHMITILWDDFKGQKEKHLYCSGVARCASASQLFKCCIGTCSVKSRAGFHAAPRPNPPGAKWGRVADPGFAYVIQRRLEVASVAARPVSVYRRYGIGKV